MQDIEYHIAKENKLIRFRTPGNFMDTKDAFFLKDGDKIQLTSGYKGSTASFVCRYLDPHHMQCGHNTYHMDEFSEYMGRAGNTYVPETSIDDLSLFSKKFYDRDLTGTGGKLIPYRQIIVQYNDQRHDIQTLGIALCPEADP